MEKIKMHAFWIYPITDEFVHDVNILLKQLTSNPPKYSIETLTKILQQQNLFVLGALDTYYGMIVGMASLKVVETTMLTQDYKTGFIGDVVVSSNYRRKGIAEEMMVTLIEIAKALNVTNLSLTSNPNNPDRTSAIKLYEKLGFKKAGELNGSNYYRLQL